MHSMVVQFHEFKYWYFRWIVHCYHIWFPTELMVFCKAICPSSLLIWFVYLSSFASSLSIWLICYSSFSLHLHTIFSLSLKNISSKDWVVTNSLITSGSFHVKWCKPGHDPSQNLIRICQIVVIYMIWQSLKF